MQKGLSAVLVEGRRVHVHVVHIFQRKIDVVAKLDAAHVAHMSDLLVVEAVTEDNEENIEK